MTKKLLPIGSIVKLHPNDIASFMIVGYYPQRQDGNIFEYLAVVWPAGYESLDEHWMFNEKDILELLHTGYTTEETTTFLENLPRFMEGANQFYTKTTEHQSPYSMGDLQ